MKEHEFVQNQPKPRKSRDADEVRAALTPWFAEKLGGAENVEFKDFLIPSGNSFSNDIILLGVKWRKSGEDHFEKFVIRVAPRENALFPDADFRKDFNITAALYATQSVPVPKPCWFESDINILGAPFCVMEQMEGRAAPDNPPHNVAGWIAEASAEERTAIWWEGIEVMARLHRIDWESAGLGFLRKASTPQGELEQDLNYYAALYDWACEGRRLDFVDQGMEWLRSNLPDVGPLGFCWGDSRMANMLFHNRKCNAVLDWEMATLGDPEKDLGYWLFFDRFSREGAGAPRREGWPSHEETIARYEQLLGRPMRNLRYYEIFAMYRMAVIMTRIIYISEKIVPLPDADSILKNHYFLTSLRDAIKQS